MDPDLFKSIHFLPDPLIGEDNHYKCFSGIYGSTTTERDCPSSQSKAKKSRSLSPSKKHMLNVDTMVQCEECSTCWMCGHHGSMWGVQHVLNVDTMVQYEECSMWRLLFSWKKLSVRDKKQLQDILADIAHTCGVTLEELDLPDNRDTHIIWE